MLARLTTLIPFNISFRNDLVILDVIAFYKARKVLYFISVLSTEDLIINNQQVNKIAPPPQFTKDCVFEYIVSLFR